jgi:hypothetical protein
VQGEASTQIVFDGSALTVPGYCRQADCDSFATQGSLDATIAQHNALEAVVDSINTRVAALEANAVAHSGLILANQNNISNNFDEIMDNTADIAANTAASTTVDATPAPAPPIATCMETKTGLHGWVRPGQNVPITAVGAEHCKVHISPHGPLLCKV